LFGAKYSKCSQTIKRLDTLRVSKGWELLLVPLEGWNMGVIPLGFSGDKFEFVIFGGYIQGGETDKTFLFQSNI